MSRTLTSYGGLQSTTNGASVEWVSVGSVWLSKGQEQEVRVIAQEETRVRSLDRQALLEGFLEEFSKQYGNALRRLAD